MNPMGAPAICTDRDDGRNPDSCVGVEVGPDHDLDVDRFEVEIDDEDAE